MATRLSTANASLASGASSSTAVNPALAATLPSAGIPRQSPSTTTNNQSQINSQLQAAGAATTLTAVPVTAAASMLGVSPTLTQVLSTTNAATGSSSAPAFSSASASNAFSGAGTANPSQIVPNPSISDRLSSLSAKFEGFHQELDLSRNQRKLDDQRKLAALQSQINSLRDSLTLESKNRATAMKALQTWLEDRIEQWAREVQIPLHEEIKALSASVQAIATRTQNLEIMQEKNKNLVPQLVELRSAELRRQIAECKMQVEQEQALRVEREKRVYAKIQDLGHRLREQLLAEKSFTDRRLNEIRADLSQSTQLLQSATERVAQQVSTQEVELRTSIHQEGETRAAAVDELARAVSHYGAALQAGIKIVSQ